MTRPFVAPAQPSLPVLARHGAIAMHDDLANDRRLLQVDGTLILLDQQRYDDLLALCAELASQQTRRLVDFRPRA